MFNITFSCTSFEELQKIYNEFRNKSTSLRSMLETQIKNEFNIF